VVVAVLAVGIGWAVLAGAAGAATTGAPPSGPPTTTGPSPVTSSPASTGAPPSGLDPLVITQPLPGFAAAPAGPTNGALTATEFASQSSDPAQARQQFDALAAAPGFAAAIRLWTDRGGPGAGANDVAILLFRISDRTAATPFLDGLAMPFSGVTGSTPFAVPSIPGARGYSVVVTSPVPAVEQVVVFRAGRYVTLVELASTSAATNPAPLSPAQAVAVGFLQLSQLRGVDPVGSVDPPAAATAPKASPATAGATSTLGGPSATTVVSVILVAMIIGLIALLCLSLRRRTRPPAVDVGSRRGVDPWAPGGVFAEFADLTGDGEEAGGPLPIPDVAGVSARRAQAVGDGGAEAVGDGGAEAVGDGGAESAPGRGPSRHAPPARMIYPTPPAVTPDDTGPSGRPPLPVPGLAPADLGAPGG
jgi:hypothetical protein